MSKQIHYLVPDSGDDIEGSLIACNVNGKRLNATSDKRRVTCDRCVRTKIYDRPKRKAK